ncbi:MAG: hypothetical protein Q9162_006107 [Coniocarpon cinnabarinum]
MPDGKPFMISVKDVRVIRPTWVSAATSSSQTTLEERIRDHHQRSASETASRRVDDLIKQYFYTRRQFDAHDLAFAIWTSRNGFAIPDPQFKAQQELSFVVEGLEKKLQSLEVEFDGLVHSDPHNFQVAPALLSMDEPWMKAARSTPLEPLKILDRFERKIRARWYNLWSDEFIGLAEVEINDSQGELENNEDIKNPHNFRLPDPDGGDWDSEYEDEIRERLRPSKKTVYPINNLDLGNIPGLLKDVNSGRKRTLTMPDMPYSVNSISPPR